MDEFQDNTVAPSGMDDYYGKPVMDMMDDDDDLREQPPPMDAGVPLVAFDDEPADIPTSTTIVTEEKENNIDSYEMLPPSKTDASSDEDQPQVESTSVESFTVTSTTTNYESNTQEFAAAETEIKQEVPEVHSNGTAAAISKVIETKDYKELSSWPVQWMEDHAIDRKIIKLIYWCEWQHTAGVFGGILFLLLSLTCYSFVSVVSTFAMSLLAVSFLYRIGMTIVNAVQKTSAEHPLRNLLEEKIELSEEIVKEVSELVRVNFNEKIKEMQRLFLIEDFIASLKFGVLLWLVSYIGSWFTMLTLSILGVILTFSLPIAYELYQKEVDQALDMAKGKFCEVYKMAESKIPENLKFSSAKKEQ